MPERRNRPSFLLNASRDRKGAVPWGLARPARVSSPVSDPSTPKFDRAMLDLAARLAVRAGGYVEPNPLVGCVITKDARIIGLGHHKRFGGLHAEREALADCARRNGSPHGSTAYVTLEPCTHTGKQPPCTDALIEAGVARVVFARPDAADQSRGGCEVLRAAGIRVECSDASESAWRLAEPWAKRVRTKAEGLELPWVIAKWAQTIDGRIATRTGESQWISSEHSRRRVHRLRARVDAILTGLGTVLADDPMLTARGVRRTRRTPRRVIADTHLETPLDCALVRTAREVPTSIACAKELATAAITADKRRALEAAGVELLPVAMGARSIDLRDLLHQLATRHDATNILIESGPGLLGGLFEADLVDEAMVYIAPMLLADASAKAAAHGRVVPSLTQARPLRLLRAKRIGDDVELAYRRG